jgi:hypothetical protein
MKRTFNIDSWKQMPSIDKLNPHFRSKLEKELRQRQLTKDKLTVWKKSEDEFAVVKDGQVIMLYDGNNLDAIEDGTRPEGDFSKVYQQLPPEARKVKSSGAQQEEMRCPFCHSKKVRPLDADAGVERPNDEKYGCESCDCEF